VFKSTETLVASALAVAAPPAWVTLAMSFPLLATLVVYWRLVPGL